MAGYMDDITSVLQSPAVTALLPATLGAVGGYLTTPRRAGAGGAIGRSMLGAATGLTAGQRTWAESAMLKQKAAAQELLARHYATQDQIAQGNLKVQQQLQDAWDNLSPADKANYPTPKIWATAMENHAKDMAGASGLKAAITQIASTPEGKARLAKAGFDDPSKLPDNKDALSKVWSAIQPLTEYQEQSLALHAQQIAASAANTAAAQGIQGELAKSTIEDRQSREQMAVTQNKEAQQKVFQAAVDHVAVRKAKLADALASGKTYRDPTLQALADDINATQERLKQEGKTKGLTYSETELAPVSLGKVPTWGGYGPDEPVLLPKTAITGPPRTYATGERRKLGDTIYERNAKGEWWPVEDH